MAATATRARPRAALGFRAGWIRPPRPARLPKTWPGDVTAWSHDLADGADVPAWINPPAHTRALIVRLAFAEGVMVALSASYAAMIYAWR